MAEIQRHDEIQGAILHEYDGIEEADNELPTWWLAIFYGTMIIAVVYWFVYHEFELAPTPNQEHAAYVAKKEKERAEQLAKGFAFLENDTAAAAAGAETFKTNCVACHLAQGQGQIGPNLTDDYWIHGGDADSIHKIITEGVAAKGMPPWGSILGPQKVEELTAFVLTLRGKNVAGKAPEGELYKPGG